MKKIDMMNFLQELDRVLREINNRDKILFVGRFVNTNQVKTVPITEMVKTEEFGGQTGGKENKSWY